MTGGAALFPDAALAEDVYPRAYAYYFRQWQAFDMPFHRHDSTEIMYVIRGECRVEVSHRESAPPDAFGLTNGEFVVIGANVPHRLVVEGTCRMLNVEFNFLRSEAAAVPSMRRLAAEERALSALLSAPEPYLLLRDPDEVYYALKALVLELDAAGANGGTMAHLLFAQLLIRIARLREERRGEPQAERYVRQCIAFMSQNYDRDIGAKDIAAAVNLHPGYVHRLFKAQTGRTVNAYLTSLRIEKAKMLLQRTDIPIADISDAIGIGSRQYFHALFKRMTNRTPAEYRQTMMTQKWDVRGKGDDS
ncbi:AraC family transcriptional regulator [Paenibacillus sp.]|uniref:AraC family transcriptional regulator n=1 Tax=Paenibacillus sp. TaxID=58172 RepID=UPI002D406CE5|nr:AraC family transcriptional regulator [Paenibacillus sp.]HZG86631.1 AraC family transcriptional regulator [Paenibacillus sp.]